MRKQLLLELLYILMNTYIQTYLAYEIYTFLYLYVFTYSEYFEKKNISLETI